MDDARVERRWGSLLWRSWEALGVGSWERGAPRTVIDLEALVVATLAHDDLRLQGETVDWAIQHQYLLNGHRLRALVRDSDLEDAGRAWLEQVTSTDPTVGRTGKSAVRGTALAPGAATAALRLRFLTGATVRSEVVRALHAVLAGAAGPMSVTELVEAIGVSRAHILRALGDLVAGGFIDVGGSPRRRRYEPAHRDALASSMWSAWRHYAYGPWLTAARTVPGLLKAHQALARPTVSAVAGALEVYESHFARLAVLTGRPADATPIGDARGIAPELRALIGTVVEDAITRLDAPRDEPPASVRSPWSGTTWIQRPTR